MTNEQAATTLVTRDVARHWFSRLLGQDLPGALRLMDDQVEFINHERVPGINSDLPWIGTHRGVREVSASLQVFASLVDVEREELITLAVEGEQAVGVLHEAAAIRSTGLHYDVEYVQWLTVREGRIVRWKSYTDPSGVVRGLRGG